MRISNYAAIAIASLSLLGAASAARAEETTTTTTTRSSDAPGGIVIGVPGVVGLHIGGDARPEGCTTRKTTHTDEETGDSVTQKSTTCD